MSLVYIGLGTNLGDRAANLRNTRALLEEKGIAAIVKASSVMETEPVDHLDQPRFLNQVIMARTELDPFQLLHALKSIEKDLGRALTAAKGPRIIDLDILLYEGLILETDELAIPHPEITNRGFVMEHLVELDPDIHDPITGEKYSLILIRGDVDNYTIDSRRTAEGG